jgi:hypothetical protein
MIGTTVYGCLFSESSGWWKPNNSTISLLTLEPPAERQNLVRGAVLHALGARCNLIIAPTETNFVRG